MGNSNRNIIQAILLAAAILALLLTTPSLHARTLMQKKTHTKKMKIVFDGNESSSSGGELGDELKPRASSRDVDASVETVHLRGNSMDDIWAKNGTSRIKGDIDDASDLIDPVSMNDIGEAPTPKRKRTGSELAASDPSVDESSLASFKKSPKHVAAKPVRPRVTKTRLAARPRPVVKTRTVRATESHFVYASAQKPHADVDVETVKAIPAKTPARPASRTSARGSTPIASADRLSTRVRTLGEPSEFTFNFAFESTVTMGRKYQLETPGDRNFAMKNEAFIGSNHSSGWGAKLSFDYITTSNDDATKNISEVGDPSLIVSHPSLYKTRDLDVYGRFRYYAPVAASSRAVALHHFAYYFFTDLTLPSQVAVSNAFVPRYYQQSTYADSDAFSLLFDSTEITKKLNWLRLGLGQQTQIESHQATAPGTTAEIYPFFDFLGISNALFEAKLYLPVYAKGLVGGGPVAASISNVQAEFFMKLSF